MREGPREGLREGMLSSLSASDAALLERAGIGDPGRGRGLFREESWLRRVGAEQLVLLGGGRALLLEIAHPLVAAGVADHSDFRADPFGRLQRTLDAMGAITFGDRSAALAAARRVQRAHARVRGRLAQAAGRYPAGTSYSGRDPELVLWVWATLADTALVIYERFLGRLDAAAREDYYAGQCAVARLLGVPAPRVPRGSAAFRAYFDGMLASDALAVTPTSRAIADAVLGSAAPPGTRGPLRTLTAGLLPERLRDEFGLSWGPAEAARFDALVRSVRALRGEGPRARDRQLG